MNFNRNDVCDHTVEVFTNLWHTVSGDYQPPNVRTFSSAEVHGNLVGAG